MTARSKIVVTGILLLCIVALAGIDAAINRREFLAYLPENNGEASAPETGVAKQAGPDVAAVLSDLGMQPTETGETSLLAQIVGAKAETHTFGILKDNDRVGSVTWVESPQVKTYFNALKEALLPAFSPAVRDLRDMTEAKPGLPVRNILTFEDKGLGPDHFAFVRAHGDRFYEFHIVEGKEETMGALIDELTAKRAAFDVDLLP